MGPNVVSDTGLTPVMGDGDRAEAGALSRRGTKPPARVPGYADERFLGHGAYGEVWTATNRNSGRRVAIKFFTRRGGTDWAALAREVEKLRYLFSDRYVVQLFEIGWEADPPYYVMEYMEGGSLEDLLRARRPTVPEAVSVFRDVATALVHAHDKGVLHCDLKPANVLLDHEQRPRLADFGQSRLTNEASPALGTLFYMAPEQADLTAVPDARWDVYALGALAYRLLTGDAPHRATAGATEVGTGPLEAQLAAYQKLLRTGPKPTAHRAVPGVDAGLAAIVDRCLEPNPAKRFPNPQAVLTALDQWQLARVRKPLLRLTAGVFVALFLALALAGAYLFRTSVGTAARGVEGRALDANSFAAQTEARQLAAQVQLRWVQLEAAARSPQLKALLARGPEFETDAALGAELDALLAERRARADRQFAASDRSSLWFAHDARGFQRGCAPVLPAARNVYRGYRDYFHGGGDLKPDAPPRPPIAKPHRSVAYRRERPTGERIWSVAFSVPVLADGPEPRPLGVVGMTIDLADAPPEQSDHFAVLIDTRPDARSARRGLVLRHPYWAELKGDPDPPLFYADEVVRWMDAHDGGGAFEAGAAYTDPVAAGRPAFAGEWLAAVNRVRVGPEKVDTGWVVLVQERRDGVLEPVRALQWRLGYAALAAGVTGFALVALMWLGVVSVMDPAARSPVARVLRRWAGLPGHTATAAPATATPATARAAATPTPPK